MQGFNNTSLKPWLAGIGFAALMMAGCLQTEPQSPATTDTTVPATESLRLSIRPTDSCKAQMDELIQAFEAAKGDTSKLKVLAAAHTGFVAACVEKSEPTVKHDGKEHLKLPPSLRPDSGSHCRWHMDKVGKDDSSLTISYHHNCEDKVKPEDKETDHEQDSSKFHGPNLDSLKADLKEKMHRDSSEISEHVKRICDSAAVHSPKLDSLKAELEQKIHQDSVKISEHIKEIRDSVAKHIPNLDSLRAEIEREIHQDSAKISEHIQAIRDSVAKHMDFPKPPEHSKPDSLVAH